MKGKLGKWMIGRKMSKERIQKTASKTKGQKRTDESKLNYRNSRLGDKNPMYGKIPWNKRITDDQVREIRAEPIVRVYGHCAKLAKKYGIKSVTVHAILNNRLHKSVC